MRLQSDPLSGFWCLCQVFDGLRRRALPLLYKALEPGTDDDRMKGALWTLNLSVFGNYDDSRCGVLAHSFFRQIRHVRYTTFVSWLDEVRMRLTLMQSLPLPLSYSSDFSVASTTKRSVVIEVQLKQFVYHCFLAIDSKLCFNCVR